MIKDKWDSAKGSLIGLALGDALGTTLEFQPRPASPIVTKLVGGGPFNLQPGQWTDDTSMMLCLADSLIECGSSQLSDQMDRYIAWRDKGYNSCTGECFDIGNTVSSALRQYQSDGIALAGSTDSFTAGNGSLMRIAPVALFTHHRPLVFALNMAADVSRTTHAEQRCIDSCQYMTYLLHQILNSEFCIQKAQLLNAITPDFDAYVANMHPDSIQVIRGSYRDKSRQQIHSSGYVIHSLEAALWCFWHSNTFVEGAILAANLGDDADTVAAIYGQLAGAYYGYNGLPKNWLNTIYWHDDICRRATLLLARQSNLQIKRFIAECKVNIIAHFSSSAARYGLQLNGWDDWSSWMRQHQYLCEAEQIGQASIDECLCLITALIRGERFCDGLLESSNHRGTLDAILTRLEHLATDDSIQRRLFIGDIHGQYQKLEEFLDFSDANEDNDDTFYVFIGDLIDNVEKNGIEQVKVLARVKSLVDAGRAECLMGNHEFNAIGWAMKHPETGKPLRPHSESNLKQHIAFLNEVTEGSAEHQKWINWFKKRPLFADFVDIRAIHACWDENAISRLKTYLNPDYSLKDQYWINAFDKQSELYHLIELLLKGPELTLPEGYYFTDRTGKQRQKIRVCWWLDKACTYQQLAQVPYGEEHRVPSITLPEPHVGSVLSVPVVIGHYSLSGYPIRLSNHVACVDYNAAKDEQPIVAYEWFSGESVTLDNQAFYFVDKQPLHSFHILGMERVFQHHIEQLQNTYALTDPLIDIVDNFLWKEWDPIGVNSLVECRDEYQAYVKDTCLLALAGDAEILAAWLWFIESAIINIIEHDHQAVKTRSAMLAIQLITQTKKCSP